MPDPFKLDGTYSKSSDIPTITVDGKDILRKDFWKQQIDKTAADLPPVADGQKPVYIATGGGYGSFDKLVTFERSQGKIGPEREILSIKGAMFRDLPEFAAEKERVREQIRAHLTNQGIEAKSDAVEQILSAFYSDEVNTKIGKEVVKAAFPAKKSAIYESASIYPDTVERAEAAKKEGIKTVLLAGDKDFRTAIDELKSKIEPGNTAISYQKFSERFQRELVPLFDEIRLYNTDQDPPRLIAEKKGPDQALHVLDSALFAKFLANGVIDPEPHKSSAAGANVIHTEHKAGEKPKEGQAPTPPPLKKDGPKR